MHRPRLAELAVALAAVAPLAGQTLDETFARMDKTAKDLKAVTADMRRDVHTAVINDDAVDNGILRLKRERSHETRMLIDMTGRDAKTVSLVDSVVTVYYPKIKTAQEYNVGERKQMVEQFLLLGFGASTAELKQVYDVSWVGAETVAGEPTGHLKLVPKSTDISRQVAGAELWMSTKNGLPVQQKIIFTSGDYWLVNYSNIKFNPPLSDDDVKIKLPKGVKIEHPRF